MPFARGVAAGVVCVGLVSAGGGIPITHFCHPVSRNPCAD
jgi:hypothetical protein